MPQDGHLASDLLRLAQEVPQPGAFGAPPFASSRRRTASSSSSSRTSAWTRSCFRRWFKKALKPAKKRTLVTFLQDKYRVSQRRACAVLKLFPSTFRYKTKRPDQAPLKADIQEIANTRVRYGYLRIHALLRRERWTINVKRT